MPFPLRALGEARHDNEVMPIRGPHMTCMTTSGVLGGFADIAQHTCLIAGLNFRHIAVPNDLL